MALVLWAKSAAGTKVPFFKSFGKAVKICRELFQRTVLKKVPKTHPNLHKADVRDRCLPRSSLGTGKFPDSFSARLFRSLISTPAARLLSKDIVRRSTLSARIRTIPLLSLIGITLGVDVESLMENDTQGTVSGIKEAFENYNWYPQSLHKHPQCLDDLLINTEQSLASGCEGVVYEATIKQDAELKADRPERYDLALKAVFNYGAESNATSIMRGLGREMVPLQSIPESQSDSSDDEIPSLSLSLPPHPNIVEMPSIFIDNVLVTEEGLREFPAALPHRSDPSQCFGRNKTVYLVMKKTTNNLRTYLAENPDISMATRCFLLAQLLEGIAHLTAHGVAHRDLKSDNLLVDLPVSSAWPRLEICDFGCCLAEQDKRLTVPFPSLDLFRGGNDWLMAPEIRTAVPGPDKVLDFKKSDLWAAGALAYEILGAHNPFYPSQDYPDRRLKNTTYSDEELPPLPDEVPEPIRQMVKSLLARDPEKRPSAGVAATVAQMVVLSFRKNGAKRVPKYRHPNGARPRKVVHCGKAGIQRFLPLTKEELLFQQIWTQSLGLICLLKVKGLSDGQSMDLVNSFVFLSRLTYREFRAALKYF